jgi:7-cyano-7-deazaguanine reductase
MQNNDNLDLSLNKLMPLGKTVDYDISKKYNPELLFPISRRDKRQELNIHKNLPFMGADIWNCYEISWLNSKGKPQVAIAQITISCDSQNIIESKSLKLYLNSFNNNRFDSIDKVKATILIDIKSRVNGFVQLKIIVANDFDTNSSTNKLSSNTNKGICIDRLDIDMDDVFVHKHPEKSTDIVHEILYSNLLKSNCLITGQPDWASISIGYSGIKIDQEWLLRYIISFRQHQEFHEQCVERIFMHIQQNYKPLHLWVYAQYTRRGGIDINPFRSSSSMSMPEFIRHARQ